MQTISAWTDYAKADSPDGRYSAVYNQAVEVAQGSPTLGVLSIYDKATGDCLVKFGEANGSFVWSVDSTALAFPRWDKSNWLRGWIQRLVVVQLPYWSAKVFDGKYGVLELDTFRGGVIEGVDSPIHQPKKIRVHVSDC